MPTKNSRGSTNGKRNGNGNGKSGKTSPARSSARATVSGPSHPGGGNGDDLAEKMSATEAPAAAMPFNANKAGEYGDASAEPQPGATVAQPIPRATAAR